MNSASIWKSTLHEFRAQVASLAPVPAGVSVSSVSASLGVGLLIKVLEIIRKHNPENRDAEMLLRAAREQLSCLERYADDDIAAYSSYISAKRDHREEEVATALRQATEVPLRAARAANIALELCNKTVAMTPANIAPDLGAATCLLAGAIRAILLSVASNVKQVSDPKFFDTVEIERDHLSHNAETLASAILHK